MKPFLIVGLGNIGVEYCNTRHNIGFKAVDFFVDEFQVSFETAKYGSLAFCSIKGKKVIVLKPNTYMNLSGKAVKYWMDKEAIPIENILVITDDLNLNFGTIRIKPKGSDGGHNGLKNINAILNTQDYARLRFGIHDAFKKGTQVDYVLGNWNETEIQLLSERLETTAQAIKSFCTAGLNTAMNLYNGK